MARKTLNVSDELFYKVDIEAARAKKFIYEVVAEAWELYERNQLGASPPPMPDETRLIAKFLKLWREPEGMEIPLRTMIASILEEKEPPLPEQKQ